MFSNCRAIFQPERSCTWFSLKRDDSRIPSVWSAARPSKALANYHTEKSGHDILKSQLRRSNLWWKKWRSRSSKNSRLHNGKKSNRRGERQWNEVIRRKARNCYLASISVIFHKPGLPRTCTKSRKNRRWEKLNSRQRPRNTIRTPFRNLSVYSLTLVK